MSPCYYFPKVASSFSFRLAHQPVVLHCGILSQSAFDLKWITPPGLTDPKRSQVAWPVNTSWLVAGQCLKHPLLWFYSMVPCSLTSENVSHSRSCQQISDPGQCLMAAKPEIFHWDKASIQCFCLRRELSIGKATIIQSLWRPHWAFHPQDPPLCSNPPDICASGPIWLRVGMCINNWLAFCADPLTNISSPDSLLARVTSSCLVRQDGWEQESMHISHILARALLEISNSFHR